MSSALRGVEVLLQPLLTTTGNGHPVAVNHVATNHNVCIKGVGTTSGGTISIEEASDPDYTGDWSVIQAVNASDVTSDAQKVIHIVGLIRAIRARVSSDITGGGSISVGLVSY